MSPFRIDGPTCVLFSGGRTSGLMLRRVLDENGLHPDMRVLFANTGKERPETLDFVHEVETRWGVPITWLEFVLRPGEGGALREHFVVVDYATASRDGHPFEELIRWKRFLPSPVTRLCTGHLKVKPSHAFLKSLGWTEWVSFVGIRYDEPRRWRIRGTDPKASPWEERRIPLADARITKADVREFWAAQPFDLKLRSWEGNCDLCFMKGRDKVERCIRDQPNLAEWWSRQEGWAQDFAKATKEGRSYFTFRSDRPSYADLVAGIGAQPMLPILDDEPDGSVSTVSARSERRCESGP